MVVSLTISMQLSSSLLVWFRIRAHTFTKNNFLVNFNDVYLEERSTQKNTLPQQDLWEHWDGGDQVFLVVS